MMICDWCEKAFELSYFHIFVVIFCTCFSISCFVNHLNRMKQRRCSADGRCLNSVLWETRQTFHECVRRLSRRRFLPTEAKFTSPKMFTVELLEPPVFPVFLCKNTHILCNSSCSSCSGVPSLVMSSYVWSFWLGSFTAAGEKNCKTELMCAFVLHGRGEPFFSPSTNRKTLATFSRDRGRQWQRERSQSDIDLNQTNPPLVPMWP